MSHELRIKKESHFELKKRLFDLGYNHGYKGIEVQEPESAYYLWGYQKGKKTAQKFSKSQEKTNTIEDRV